MGTEADARKDCDQLMTISLDACDNLTATLLTRMLEDLCSSPEQAVGPPPCIAEQLSLIFPNGVPHEQDLMHHCDQLEKMSLDQCDSRTAEHLRYVFQSICPSAREMASNVQIRRSFKHLMRRALFRRIR